MGFCCVSIPKSPLLTSTIKKNNSTVKHWKPPRIKCVVQNKIHTIKFNSLNKFVERNVESFSMRNYSCLPKVYLTFTGPKGRKLDNIILWLLMVRISKKSAKLLSLPTTCNWIARFHVAPANSFNSQLNSPFDLSSTVVTSEINRETLRGVELTLNRGWKLALTGPACPVGKTLTTKTPLNRNWTEIKADDWL